MRRVLLLLVASLVLVAGPAFAATKIVQITRSGFVPSTVTIATGDRVTWRNSDTSNHQVVADNGTFASPILRPGRTYSFTFRAAGTYRYRDTFRSSFRGAVRVVGPPPSVSIAASQPIVYWGKSIVLSGVISSRRAGEPVTVLYRPYPQASFVALATVVTREGGVWDLVTKPSILTAYQAQWRGASSVPVAAEVKPLVTIWYSRRTKMFWTRVAPERGLFRRTVYLQRLSRFGQWVTIKRVRLRLNGPTKFRATLPRGFSRVRIFLTVNQAGPGYLASWSGTWGVTRR